MLFHDFYFVSVRLFKEFLIVYDLKSIGTFVILFKEKKILCMMKEFKIKIRVEDSTQCASRIKIIM